MSFEAHDRSLASDAEEALDKFEFPSLSSPGPAGGPKKQRRQTAFYPNVNSSNKLQKPFSRSAAKRESVMALGSIEHLQHYFTKTGLAAKQKYVLNHSNATLCRSNYSLKPAQAQLWCCARYRESFASPSVPITEPIASDTNRPYLHQTAVPYH